MNNKKIICTTAIGVLMSTGAINIDNAYADSIKGNYEVIAESLNIRSERNSNSEILGKLSKGKEVVVVEESNGWSKVAINNTYGFCSSSYLKKIEPIKSEKSNTKSSQKEVTIAVNLRKEKKWSSASLAVIQKGAKVNIISTDSLWSYVEYEGKNGYIANDYLKNVEVNNNNNGSNNDNNNNENNNNHGEEVVYEVTATSLNVRSKESTSSTILGKLSKGTKINVISIKSGWAKIKYNSGYGYCSTSYLKKVEISEDNSGGIITPETPSIGESKIVTIDVNLRKDSTWSSEILRVINKGEKVILISKGDLWSYVEYQGKKGYIANEYLKGVEEDKKNEEEDTPSVISKKELTIDVNLRKEGNWSSELLILIKSGEKVNLISQGDEWSHVEYNGTRGYISNKYLQDINDDETENKKNIYQVNTASLNVRSGPSTSFTILGKLSIGTEVEVISINNGWAKIQYNNKDAYCSMTYLTEAIWSDMNTNEKVEAVIKLANAQLGKPYKYGATGPNSFDCSGLTQYVYKNAVGVAIPRVSSDQAKTGKSISYNNLQPGDLVFFNTSGSGISHVGIYIGNNEMIHAPSSGKTISIVNIKTNSYWSSRYVTARRIIC